MKGEDDTEAKKPVKPKRRWFQYRLKTMFLLPVIVGLVLGIYLNWDWKRHRPPFQDYDWKPYQAAFSGFLGDMEAGRLDDAYESTSARFKNNTSRSEFEDLARQSPQHKLWVLLGRGYNWKGPQGGNAAPLRNWATFYQTIDTSDDGRHHLELWVWVVMEDSVLYRRPPRPRVEEIQLREVERDVDTPYDPFDHPMHPSWEQE